MINYVASPTTSTAKDMILSGALPQIGTALDLALRLHTSLRCFPDPPREGTLKRWYDSGRLLICQILTHQGWLTLLNVYLPQDAERRAVMAHDLSHYMDQHSDRNICLLGDFNMDNDSPPIARAARHLRWRNMASEGAKSTPTWRQHDHESSIDNIILSPSIADQASVLQTHDLQRGHLVLSCRLCSLPDPEEEFVIDHLPARTWQQLPCPLPLELESEFLAHCEADRVSEAWCIWNRLCEHYFTPEPNCHKEKGRVPSLRLSRHTQEQRNMKAFIQRWTHSDHDNRARIMAEWWHTQHHEQVQSWSDWRRRMKASLLTIGREYYAWLRGPQRNLPGAYLPQRA